MPRISLRQLLILVAVVALAIVSLKYASEAWQAVVGLATMLACFAAVIGGIFDRGPRRAFAAGFALVVLGYLLLLMISGAKPTAGFGLPETFEYDLNNGQLPTTVLLRNMYGAIVDGRWFDTASGRQISVEEATAMHVSFTGSGPPPAHQQVLPPAENFARVGHYWWALLLGYLGGSFSRLIYVRRTREQSAPPPAG